MNPLPASRNSESMITNKKDEREGSETFRLNLEIGNIIKGHEVFQCLALIRSHLR
jgi:hypothetical protein